MIAILCPTRGRPEQCKRMIESVAKTTTQLNVSSLLCVSLEDKHAYEEMIHELPFPEYNKGIAWFNHDMMPTAYKWNELARRALLDKNRDGGHSQKLFMLGADDMIFETSGWDAALLDHYNNLENKIHVYALQDSRDENGTPHVIVTREYIEAMGYFVPPIFLHWYVDSWTVEIAKANNCFTHFKDFTLRHDKPSDRGEGDETHHRIRDFGWRSRDQFVNDKCQHFLEVEKERLARCQKN